MDILVYSKNTQRQPLITAIEMVNLWSTKEN